MNKNIVIFGEAQSGKTFLARNIAKAFFNPVFINGRDFFISNDFFRFSNVKKDTDLIVIDDLRLDLFYEIVFQTYNEKIQINPLCEPVFEMKTPKVIFTIDTNLRDIKNLGGSVYRRIKLIHTEIEIENNSRIFLTNEFEL